MKKIPILVVGDWLVDEHWVVGDHRSPSSSRTGQRHSRALHAPNCSVRSLCGAGQVATILHEAKSAGDGLFELVGLGLWHKKDNDLIKGMLSPLNNVTKTHYHLFPGESDKSGEAEAASLYNLAMAVKEDDVVGTTRVIRIYRQTGDLLQLIHRVDWELPVEDSCFSEIENGFDRTLESLRSGHENIEHIIVKDLQKGTVTKELVKKLGQLYKDAFWYVSSKAWNPQFYECIPKKMLKLLFIPQLAAWRAIEEDHIASSSWITGGGASVT